MREIRPLRLIGRGLETGPRGYRASPRPYHPGGDVRTACRLRANDGRGKIQAGDAVAAPGSEATACSPAAADFQRSGRRSARRLMGCAAMRASTSRR